MSKKYTADFETTTDINDCRVWAYGICSIDDNYTFQYGNSIDEFMEICANKKENAIYYFHNIKFDGAFIMDWLLKNGYTWIKDKKERKDKSFLTLISSLGAFYSIEVYFKVGKSKVNKVTFYDSLKILNFKVEEIAKAFNLKNEDGNEVRKAELDYKLYREVGHLLTDEEVFYLHKDVEIMARALKIMFDRELNRMTIGSDALKNYKDSIANFDMYFPELPNEVDYCIRKSYKGGFTYLNPLYKEKETGKGVVLDVNSLYPSVMVNESLPIGYPIYFKGKYQDNKLYNLYVQSLICSFKVKPGKIPTIQLKGNIFYKANEYIEDTKGDIVTLVLTNVDLELFFEHYDVEDLKFIDGYMFKSMNGLFTNYINKWTEEKIKAKKENNKPMYLISKLMLNSLYGKFGKNPVTRCKKPIIYKNRVAFDYLEKEEGKGLYIPVATFITSYARKKTIESSQKIRDYTLEKYGKDMYVYSDTDSIHTTLTNEKELKSFLEIDDYILGYWKYESTYLRGKYLRQKCYIELQPDGSMNVTVAGLPKFLGKYITFDNFEVGFTTENLTKEKKLTYKYVPGGVVLVETEFSIKEE